MYNTALIREFVDACGSVKLAGDLIGINQVTLSRALKGMNIRMGTFYALVDALGVSRGELIGCPCGGRRE